MENNQYYYPLKDGYDVGDIIQVGNYKYEILEIEAFNQIMLIEEINDPENDRKGKNIRARKRS
tara:strand:+ start:1547 stop:1735 length:189 start_codon:yes stop_codon:yes gene_type:complete